MSQQSWGPPPPNPGAGGWSPYGQAPPGWGQPGGGQRGFQQPVGQPYGQNPYGQNQPPQNPYGQNPYGQPPGMQPYGRRPGGPAPRKRSSIGALLLTGVVLGLLLLGGLVVSNLGAPESTASYQNEDYQVPPPDTSPPAIPQPETYGEAEQLLTANPFYDQTAPEPVRCDSETIDVGSASDAELKEHFESLMECLVRVWQPPVEGAQWQIVRPTVTIYGREITTRCGKAEVNAFYCAADQQVYYSNLLDDAIPIVASDKWAADVVMAHEFGHALQARTAILISSAALGQQSGDEATDLQFSRRLETQADCLSGMFIRSVSTSLEVQQSDTAGILETYRAVGDDAVSGNPAIVGNHGLSRSREYWGQEGLGSGDVGSCNTYTARSNLVR